MLIKELLAEAAAPKMKYTDFLKKYNFTRGQSYHSGGAPQIIKNAKGVEIVSLDKSDHFDDSLGKRVTEYDLETSKLTGKFLRKKFTEPGALEKMDAVLSTLKLDAEHKTASDEEICKFIRKEYMAPCKDVEQLKRDWVFIKWPKSIEMRDHDHRSVYVQLVDGGYYENDSAGVGQLGMTLDEFEQWLTSKGVRKIPKPKRSSSSSYYD